MEFGFFFFSSRRRHTRLVSDWSSDVCSSDLLSPLFGYAKLAPVGLAGASLKAIFGANPSGAAYQIGRASCRERV